LAAVDAAPPDDIERIEEAYAHLGNALQLASRRIVLDRKTFRLGEQITGHVEYTLPKTDTTTEWIAAFQEGADNGTYGARWVYLNLANDRYPFSVPMDGLNPGPCELRIFGSGSAPIASMPFTTAAAQPAAEAEAEAAAAAAPAGLAVNPDEQQQLDQLEAHEHE